MSEWEIDPAQVGAVLSTTAAYIGEEGGSEGLLAHMDSIQEAITGCESAARSLPVSIALAEFCGHYFDVMGKMVAKTASGIEGAGEATNAYINGDLDMAAQAQECAGQLEEPEPPTGSNGPHPHLL